MYTANALAYMVDRFLAEWFALGLRYDEDLVADTLNKLWIRALGMGDGPKRPTLRDLTGPAASPHVGVMPASMAAGRRSSACGRTARTASSPGRSPTSAGEIAHLVDDAGAGWRR